MELFFVMTRRVNSQPEKVESKEEKQAEMIWMNRRRRRINDG
jgi:hypothetical protein